jgi:hypothetical protein
MNRLLTTTTKGTTNDLSNPGVTEGPTQALKASSSSRNTGTVIGAAVGAGALGLAACLGAIGFYAYRKKSQANKSGSNATVNTAEITLKNTENYQQIPIAGVNQQSENGYGIIVAENNQPPEESKYAKIDATKKTEKEYDHPPQFMTHEQANKTHPNYGQIDETKKDENEYENVPKLEI